MPASVSPFLVIIPTYNEIQNIESIVSAVLEASPSVDILVVDDGSPDGTGAEAERLARESSRVSVLHRVGERGLGPAYLDGFRQGIDRGYEVLVEMDADGSHPASALPTMLRLLETSDVDGVIGSRWVAGGSVVDWPRSREWISRCGSWYARLLLGLDLRDVTSGYRAYRTAALARLDLASIASRGYCFQIDLTRRIAASGARLVEVPIVFRDRVLGSSKMSGAIVFEAMLRVTWWGVERMFGRAGDRITPHASTSVAAAAPELDDHAG